MSRLPARDVDGMLREMGDAERGLPGVLYANDAVFRCEAETLLATEWMPIGRADEIPDPGDYLTAELLGEPLVIVRGDDGVVRCFSNICRHRGALIASGSGNAKRLVCPYHAWSYDRTSGALVSAPRMKDRIAPSQCDLPAVATEVWQGFIYVNLDGTAAPLAPRLSALSARLAPYRTSEMRQVFTGEKVWAANWKAVVENFLEAYHLSVVHPSTLHPITPTALARKFDGGAQFTGYCSNYREDAGNRGTGAPELSEAERRRSTLFGVFPGHLVSQAASLLVSFALFPEAANRTVVRWTISVYGDDLSEAEIEERVLLWTTVNEEDRRMLERTQLGYGSRFAQSGPLADADGEGTIADFNRYLRAKLLQPSEAG
ncbi:MAG: aromatic ring-hydroxylating dioxygenase subunit alpha [Pseudomonadota bacterium]